MGTARLVNLTFLLSNRGALLHYHKDIPGHVLPFPPAHLVGQRETQVHMPPPPTSAHDREFSLTFSVLDPGGRMKNAICP